MPYAALERMLRTERHRQRAAPRGGFSTPGLCAVDVEQDAMPLLATNMRGRFLPTRASTEGQARFGFSEVPVGREGPLLNELHRTLCELSAANQWGNRCSAVAVAVGRLQSHGIEPKSLVISEAQVASILGAKTDLEVARRAMATQGYVAMVGTMQLLLSDLPDGSAFVAGSPAALGIYMRVGDHLGMLLQRVNRAIMVVRPDVA